MKKIFILVWFFILPHCLYSSTQDLIIKLNTGILYPNSSLVRKFYDRKTILIYGGELNLFPGITNLGVYYKYQRYSFKIKDNNYRCGYFKEESTWHSIGIVKKIQHKRIDIFGKIGSTIHINSLTFNLDNNKQLGLQLGFGIFRKLSKRIQLYCETNYDHLYLRLPFFLTFTYSRDQEYLSGKNFHAGGFVFTSGLVLTLD